MTTLIGYEGKGWSVLASDSRSSDENGKFVVSKTPKIFENNGVLIGTIGNERVANLVHYGFKFPKLTKQQNIYQYLSSILIPKIREEFVKAGIDFSESEGNIKGAQFDGGFILSINGKIFTVQSDYSWDTSARGLYYQGTGGDAAAGAALALGIEKVATPQQAIKILEKATHYAISLDNNSGAPVWTWVQETK